MMLKKKILAILLAVTLLVSLFSGCKAKSDENSDVKKYGAADSRDPLRILMDLGDAGSYSAAIKSFLYELETSLGIDNVVVEFLPSGIDAGSGMLNKGTVAVRETAMDRLRVEIMAGEGPDLFLMSYQAQSIYGDMGLVVDYTDVLFKYPEQAMEIGLFLPLDDYIENHAEYANWDNFTDSVMAAGRNEEGQQLIPISYSMPLLILPKETWDYTPAKELTWDDMMHDPELLPYSLDLANCRETDGEDTYATGWLLPHVMGTLADYEKEELLFTEEELLQRVKEILAMEPTDAYETIHGAKEVSWSAASELSHSGAIRPLTILPMYSADGGVTVTIDRYAAINRNSKKADEAFRILDYLMSKSMHQYSEFHRSVLSSGGAFPMDEEFFCDAEHWLYNRESSMMPENYEELCEMRSQITGANFDGELVQLLSGVLSDCIHEQNYGDKTVEEVVHEAYENMQRRLRA